MLYLQYKQKCNMTYNLNLMNFIHIQWEQNHLKNQPDTRTLQLVESFPDGFDATQE